MKNSSYVRAGAQRAQATVARPAAPSCAEPCGIDLVHADAVRAVRGALPTRGELGRLAELFALLANPTRLHILAALHARGAGAELCVCDLGAITRASQSLTSHQLRPLRDAGLVEFRRDGRLAYYRLAEGPMRHLLEDALAHVRGPAMGRRRKPASDRADE